MSNDISIEMNILKSFAVSCEELVAILMKTWLNNVLLPTLFNFLNNIVQYGYNGDNCKQCRSQDIVQSRELHSTVAFFPRGYTHGKVYRPIALKVVFLLMLPATIQGV